MKNLQWYQNKVVSFVAFVTAVVAICGWIVTVKLYASRLESMEGGLKQVNEAIILQVQYNAKVDLIYDMTIKQ